MTVQFGLISSEMFNETRATFGFCFLSLVHFWTENVTLLSIFFRSSCWFNLKQQMNFCFSFYPVFHFIVHLNHINININNNNAIEWVKTVEQIKWWKWQKQRWFWIVNSWCVCLLISLLCHGIFLCIHRLSWLYYKNIDILI